MIDFSQPDPTHVCANSDCTHREWHVERDDVVHGLWHLRGKKCSFTMASSTLACPVCNDALLDITTLEPTLEQVLQESSVQAN
jgi:hypothetical protein